MESKQEQLDKLNEAMRDSPEAALKTLQLMAGLASYMKKLQAKSDEKSEVPQAQSQSPVGGLACRVPPVSTPTEGSFNGNPVLTLPNPEDPTKPGLQFGINKLRAFIVHESAIKAFVVKHEMSRRKADEDRIKALVRLLRESGASEGEIAKALALR